MLNVCRHADVYGLLCIQAGGDAALTYTSRKRREQVEGGRVAREGGVDLVEWCDGPHVRRPRHSVAAESTLVRRVASRRRQTLHRQPYLHRRTPTQPASIYPVFFSAAPPDWVSPTRALSRII